MIFALTDTAICTSTQLSTNATMAHEPVSTCRKTEVWTVTEARHMCLATYRTYSSDWGRATLAHVVMAEIQVEINITIVVERVKLQANNAVGYYTGYDRSILTEQK